MLAPHSFNPDERKIEMAGLMKKYVDSGLCDGYKDESGRISAPKTVEEARTRKDWVYGSLLSRLSSRHSERSMFILLNAHFSR